MDLDTIKKYLRIEHTKDDDFLTNQIESAKFYIKNTTGVEYTDGDLTYDDLIMYFVQHRYDNRVAVSDKAAVEMPYTITELMQHIALRGELSE